MYDTYRCCTLPRMRMCARTSKIKITITQRKFTQERKVGHGGCTGRENVVALRRKWQEALQMIQPSKCTWPGVRGRHRRPARRDHRSGVADRDEEELDTGGTTIKE
jgi:hypothetical protein